MLLARHAWAKAAKRVFAPGVPGIHACRVREKEDVDGRDEPGHDDFKNPEPSGRYAASAALAFSAIAWNAAGSWMARSDSTLRSTVMPDRARPLIKTL